jgi:IS5 family transposase
MARRYKKTMKGSFFGDFIYSQTIPEDHFLVQLEKVIDWHQFTAALVDAYKGKAERGSVPYEPVMILKMLLLAYLYGMSERQTEDFSNYYLPAKAFLGLGVTDHAPDHSTLTLFKVRLLEYQGPEAYAKLFDMVIHQAQGAGVTFGKVQLVDAVHTVADVNNEKDRLRRERGEPPADPDASVVHKGKRKVTKADGTAQEEEVMYSGYKTHVSMEADTGIVTSIKPTMGNVADNTQMPALVEHDVALGVPGETYAGDKAYDDGELHGLLKNLKKHSALKLNGYRTKKKDANKDQWLAMKADPHYREGLSLRYRIERKFGESKAWHRFARCRYRGLDRFKIQSYLTFITLNLKRIVLLVTGARLRPLAKHLVSG